MFYWVIPLITSVIALSAIMQHDPSHTYLLLSAAIAFVLSYFAGSTFRYAGWIQLPLLALFHGLSMHPWSMILYIAVFGSEYYRSRTRQSFVLFLLSALVYVFVRFIQSVQLTVEIFDILLHLSLFFIVFYLFNRLVVGKRQINTLIQKYCHLSRYDPLTSLLNYEEFHKRLRELLKMEQEPLALIIIDCNDLKSMNTEQGFHEGNRLLVQIAELLQMLFPEALLLSRYGGDEFAVVIRPKMNESLDSVSAVLDSELPKLSGISLTYGSALFPSQGRDKDELILKAEEHLYSMKRDIWLKREEQLFRSEKLRVVGELASGMAHEIRNPLTTVKGFLQVSKQKGYSIEPWYHLIMDEIHRMSELTAEFLSFSKPHVTNYRNQSLQKMIQRVLHLMESEANRLGHRIVYQCKYEEPLWILMDQDKMVQLLLNFVKNSFEAMDGEGIVSIQLAKHEKHVTVNIVDNGIGIAEEELDRIFHPFYSTKEIGTGLGLSICHKIVQDHGGWIDVSSEIGRGTTFQINLPLSRE